jgi:hypothetical protein
MCHLITTTLSHDTELGALRPVIREHRMALAPIYNSHVATQLPRGTLYLRATQGMCDCGTALGCLTRGDRDPHHAGERDQERLRRKGWGEAKIARWVAERERSAGRETRRAEADRWLTFIRAVLETGRTHRFGLLLHWYCGGIETERINLRDTRRLPIAQVTPDTLMEIEEDVLYEFYP